MIGRWFKRRKPVDPRREVDEATARCQRRSRALRTKVRMWDRTEKRLRRRLERAHREERALEVETLWQELAQHREEGERLSHEVRDLALEREVLRRAIAALESIETGSRESSRQWWLRCERAGLFERDVWEKERRSEQRDQLTGLLTELGGDPQRLEQRDEDLLTTLAELERSRDRQQEDESSSSEVASRAVPSFATGEAGLR